MAVLVFRAVCPDCGHVEVPLRHSGCFGAWVKQRGQISCYECGEEYGDRPLACQCDNCGTTFRKGVSTSNWDGSLSLLKAE